MNEKIVIHWLGSLAHLNKPTWYRVLFHMTGYYHSPFMRIPTPTFFLAFSHWWLCRRYFRWCWRRLDWCLVIFFVPLEVVPFLSCPNFLRLCTFLTHIFSFFSGNKAGFSMVRRLALISKLWVPRWVYFWNSVHLSCFSKILFEVLRLVQIV